MLQIILLPKDIFSVSLNVQKRLGIKYNDLWKVAAVIWIKDMDTLAAH